MHNVWQQSLYSRVHYIHQFVLWQTNCSTHADIRTGTCNVLSVTICRCFIFEGHKGPGTTYIVSWFVQLGMSLKSPAFCFSVDTVGPGFCSIPLMTRRVLRQFNGSGVITTNIKYRVNACHFHGLVHICLEFSCRSSSAQWLCSSSSVWDTFLPCLFTV